ncbi:MAG: toxic anion resistance protein [Clostridiaceae bacterium]|nr:toxic anion resistance protein [Clostridiaceae bacterium]
MMEAQIQPAPNQNNNSAIDNYDVNKWNEMTPEERQQVLDLAAQIDISDSQSIIQYGNLAQSEISKFSDAMLDQIRSKDSGEVGEVLTELLVKVQDVNIDSIDPNQKGFSFSKLFGGLRKETQKFISRYDKISVQIEKIIDQLDRAKLQLIRDIATLDTMYEKNLEYLKQLDIYIMAGSLKLKELNDKVMPELKEKAQRTGDAMDAQKVKDMAELISRFEKKIHDLKLSRMIAIQSAPQIRLIQNNDQTLVEKIQSSIMNTIPLWKNQMAIAITMLRQQAALKLQRDVTNATNNLLARNSEMLKTSSIEIAKENERGIVDIETLKKVNEDLIVTLEETLKIQQEGREKRAQVEMELRAMENDLKSKLMELKDRV